MAYAVGVNNAAGQNAGTTTTASTVSITGTLPTGAASGDRIFVVQCGSNTSGTTPANWNVLGTKDLVVGSGAVSAGGGQRYLTVYYRDYDGVWSMPAFTLTSAAQNSHWIGAVAVRKSNSTATFDTPTISTAGADFGTANTAHSAATGAFTTHRGGAFFIASVQNDNVTMTSPTITQTGGVFDHVAVTELCDGGTATGNDVAGTLHTISVHTESANAITFGGTLSAASQGGSLVFEQTETAATGTLDLGFKGVSAGADSGSGYIRDNKITLSQPARIQSISIFWGAAGGNVRAGIYADNGSTPQGGALLASTAETAVVAGWQKINVTTPVVLAAGTYWISKTISGAATFRWKSGGAGTYAASTFTYAALPNPRVTVTTAPAAGDNGWFATFSTVFSGTGSGTYTWAGSAVGSAPAAGANEGTASGTYTWVATTTGARVSRGTSSGTYTWAGSAVGAVPGAKTESLTDNFATQDTGKWNGYGTFVTVASGQLSIVPDNTFARTLDSVSNTLDLSGSYVLAEVTALGSSQIVNMYVCANPFAGDNERFEIFYQTPNMVFRELDGGVANDTSITYNATDHRWWRIRESGGTVYWDTSPDGSTWTNRRNKAWAIIGVSAMEVVFYAYTTSGSSPTLIDNFNLPAAAVKQGSSSGTYTWAGTAAGAKTPKATGSGTYTWAGTTAGARVSRGIASGTYTWVGTAAGKKTPKAAGSGTYTWAGTTAGSRISRGTTSGAYTWTGTAAGKKTPKAIGSGTYTWAGVTTGTWVSRGTTSGTYTWTGSATGSAPVVGAKQGTGSGNYTWAGTTAGARTPKATGSGNYTWAGTAAGDTPPNRGTGSGTYTWVGTATGVHTSRGTTSGTYTWSSSAAGIAPIIGVKQGTTTGAYTWSSTAAGARTSRGTTSGAYAWAGSASGVAPLVGVEQGSATGTYTFTGTAAGARASRGTTTSTYGWDGAAIGWRISSATSSGTYTFIGTADGETPSEAFRSGNTSGNYGWISYPVGTFEPFGTATGTYGWAGVAAHVPLAPLHPDRYATLTYESREMLMPGEDRTITVNGEDRSITIPAETRTIIMAGENRTITMGGEDRSIDIPGETRLITL